MINKDVKKVLVIGSGPIVIGQAAEFDYAGTQACRSLREEGVEVVLVNSNPSTIMTDVDIADRVYIEPITLPFVTEVIKKERPDALLATLGGQVGPGEGRGEEGLVAAVVKGTVAVGGIIAAGPGGHVPEQAFAGNGHQAEGHAQPAGHGQDDIVLVRVRVAGIVRGDLTAPFGQGGVGGRCRQGRQQQEEEERREQPRSHG